jgi:hypothetical protein
LYHIKVVAVSFHHFTQHMAIRLLSCAGLAASGNVNVASSNLAYSYNVTAGNQNGRSMRRLILDLNIKARVNESGTGAFYPDFQKVSKVTDTSPYPNLVAKYWSSQICLLPHLYFSLLITME